MNKKKWVSMKMNLTSVGLRRSFSLTLAFTSTLAGTSFADEECGPPIGGVVTCNGVSLNPYPNGIKYTQPAADRIRIKGGVVVDRSPGDENVGIALKFSNTPSAVELDHGTSITTSGRYSNGISVESEGQISITSAADITVQVPASAAVPDFRSTMGLAGFITTETSSASVELIQQKNSTIRVSGMEGIGIAGSNEGTGSTKLIVSGSVFTAGYEGFGAYARNVNAASDTMSIMLTESGSISTTGERSDGIYGVHDGTGDALALAKGTITTTGEDAGGILLRIHDAASSGRAHIIATEGATVQTSGDFANGMYASNEGLGAAIIHSEGVVATSGTGASGIKARIEDIANSADATVSISKGARISTKGGFAHAIDTWTPGAGSAAVIMGEGTAISTAGSQAHGVESSSGGDVLVVQDKRSKINTSGDQSSGTNLAARNKLEGRFNGEIRSTGQFGVGVSGYSSTSTSTVLIGREAIIGGGWQPEVEGQGADSGRPAAGVMIGSEISSQLVNNGWIEAGSDRAIADMGRATQDGGHLDVANYGNVLGFVEYADRHGNLFTNNTDGIFSIRHFADTDGDGLRDTKRVSVSDFGANTSIFDNRTGAIVRLSRVIGETNVDLSNYYLPSPTNLRPVNSNVYSLNSPGVVQGQLVNLGVFRNSGTIDLTGPATGNTLVITDNASPNLGAGNGLFISDGGHLILNAVIDGGATSKPAESYADVLVVDGTRVGSGPTEITVARREGDGSSKGGNGILLVEVRNKAVSSPNVFSLAGDLTIDGKEAVVQGAYAYSLFHNGVGGDADDGNWYLRKASLAPTVPVYESYPQILLEMVQLPSLPNRGEDRLWIGPQENSETAARGGNLGTVARCDIAEEAGYDVIDHGECIDKGGFWVHLEGERGRYSLARSASDAEYKYDSSMIQFGLDGILVEGNEGTLIGGVNIRRDQSSALISALGAKGGITSEGYGAGATLTWYASDGFYVDGQAHATWLKGDLVSHTLDQSLVTNNSGFGSAIGLEAGQRVRVDMNWTLVPQAQLIYSRIEFDDFVDPYGAAVALSDGESLRSRVGAAVEYSTVWKEADGTRARLEFHSAANIFNEFFDGTRVSLSGTDAVAQQQRVWGGVEFGGAYAWNDEKYAVYGKASLTSGLADLGESHTISGTLGFKVRW